VKRPAKITIFIIALLVFDQIIKILVKTNMTLGESIDIFSWFKIYFIENPGMAFGMSLGSKALLTIFRIVVSIMLAWAIAKLVKGEWNMRYLYCLGLVFAGAVGNIVDSLFYGLIFTESTVTNVATFVPIGEGYTTFLHGKVVDMFYFPLFTFPNWLPIVGGEIFFSPIFNFADSCITVGVILLILFFRREFNDSFESFFKKKA